MDQDLIEEALSLYLADLVGKDNKKYSIVLDLLIRVHQGKDVLLIKEAI